MAREKVVRIICDRCKKTEFIPPPTVEKTGAIFEASFQGKRLVYEDLCTGCLNAVAHLYEELRQWDRERKYTILQNTPVVAPDKAVPLTPAPNYTPVQPHSAASMKR